MPKTLATAALILPATSNYIVASVAIANGAQTIAHQPDVPRNITITVTDANASIDAGTVTVTGTDISGNPVSEVMTMPANLTKTGTKTFKKITSVVVASLHGQEAGDTIVVGIGANAQLTIGATHLVSAVITGGAGTSGPYTIIDGTSGTTGNVAVLKAGVREQTYPYDCMLGSGLRVVVAGTESVTINYEQ